MAEEMKAPDDLFLAVLEGLPGFHAKLFPMEALKNARPPFFFYAQTREEEDGQEPAEHRPRRNPDYVPAARHHLMRILFFMPVSPMS